jgi:DNA-binding NarL/FixJ family response regulator
MPSHPPQTPSAHSRSEAQASGRVRTLLVDDHPAFLEAARRFLATLPVQVVGEAHSGREALRLLDALHPALLLLDLELPEVDGLTVLRQVKARPSPPRVVVVTLHDQEEIRAAAEDAGADGFVGKGAFTTALAPLLQLLFLTPETP